MTQPLGRRLAAEALGTAFLLAIIIGSGIMGERLSGGNDAIALLANSLATGCGLAVLILARAASDTFAGIRPADAPGFILAQLAGAAAATLAMRWMLRASR